MIDGLYINLLLGTRPDLLSSLNLEEQLALFTRQLKMHAAFHFLVSTTIFTVKIAFLYFFGKVLKTLGRKRLYIFWKLSVLVTVVFCVYFMLLPFIACPNFGPIGGELCFY